MSTRSLAASLPLSLALSFSAAFAGPTQGLPPLSIYGNDSRIEASTASPAITQAVQATAALFASRHIAVPHGPFSRLRRSKLLGNTQTLRDLRPFGQPLCTDDTAFVEQPLGPSCTGVLVGPREVLTAAHCVMTLGCEELVIGFGFTLGRERIRGRDLYACKEVVRINPWTDLALVKLDRRVRRVQPIAIPANADLQRTGDALVLIGYPLGLPLKVAGDAQILALDQSEAFFQVNADAFIGNSGSPLVSPVDGSLQGILSGGPADFVQAEDRPCLREVRSPQIPADSTDSEKAVRLQTVLDFLNDTTEAQPNQVSR